MLTFFFFSREISASRTSAHFTSHPLHTRGCLGAKGTTINTCNSANQETEHMSNDRSILLRWQPVFRKNENKPTLLKIQGETTITFTTSNESSCSRMAHGWHSGRSKLTNNVEVVRMIDGPVIVLHHAGIISFVRRDHAFHNKAPMLVSYLQRGKAVTGHV